MPRPIPRPWSARARRGLAGLLVAVAATGAVGCGNERTPVPDLLTPGPRLGDNPVSSPETGVELIAPAGWTVSEGEPPLHLTISQGTLIVSVLRYPRTEPLPRTAAELERATTDLLAAAKARDPTFTSIRTARTEIDGRPAVQVRGTVTISGRPRTVRSTHIYAFGGEVVIDMLAPNDLFRRVDEATFRPLLRSVELSEPRA